MYYKRWIVEIQDGVAQASWLGGRIKITGLVKNVLPRLEE